jgi:hypothetical protein
VAHTCSVKSTANPTNPRNAHPTRWTDPRTLSVNYTKRRTIASPEIRSRNGWFDQWDIALANPTNGKPNPLDLAKTSL